VSTPARDPQLAHKRASGACRFLANSLVEAVVSARSRSRSERRADHRQRDQRSLPLSPRRSSAFVARGVVAPWAKQPPAPHCSSRREAVIEGPPPDCPLRTKLGSQTTRRTDDHPAPRSLSQPSTRRRLVSPEQSYVANAIARRGTPGSAKAIVRSAPAGRSDWAIASARRDREIVSSPG
jgi:hypothetical protein